jgi:CheY-like chemotaxis protein
MNPDPATARYDVFEPGDKTALVCLDVPEMERIVAEQLNGLSYKVHTGLSVDDLLFKLRAHPYDVVVLAENFGAAALDRHPLLHEIISAPPAQRHRQIVAIIGASMRTADEMQAFQYSVDLVVNLADIRNVRPVLRRAAQRAQEFYGRYLEALAVADVA